MKKILCIHADNPPAEPDDPDDPDDPGEPDTPELRAWYKLGFNGTDMNYQHMAEIAQIGFVTRISDPDTNQLILSQKAEGVFGAEVFSGCRALNPIGFFEETKSGDTIQVTFEICERSENHSDERVLYTTDAFTFTL